MPISHSKSEDELWDTVEDLDVADLPTRPSTPHKDIVDDVDPESFNISDNSQDLPYGIHTPPSTPSRVSLPSASQSAPPARHRTHRTSTTSHSNSLTSPSSSLGKRKAESTPTSPVRPAKCAKKTPEWATKLPSDAKVKVNPTKCWPESIVHNSSLEKLFQKHNISVGVKWELARFIAVDKIDPEYLMCHEEIIASMAGRNAIAAPKTLTLVGQNLEDDPMFKEEKAAKVPWSELDKELQALSTNPFAGLGNNPDFPGWYGGKVTFSGKLELVDPFYKIKLNPPALGPSNRATRRFGSSNFIKLKVTNQIIHLKDNQLDDYFMHPIFLWDWVFRAFYAKDDNVFLFRTSEIVSHGIAALGPPGTPGLTFEEFITWANPPEFNQNQLMCKWASRMALCLSNSVPGPKIEQKNIREIPDIVNEDPETGEKSDMTDGHGNMTRAVSTWILNSPYGIPSFPTTIQLRIAGWKGLTSITNDFTQSECVMFLRPSQLKIKSDPTKPLDPAHLTIDMLRTSHLKCPSRISCEVIRNLEDNGVPSSVFKGLMDKQIQVIFDSLTEWADPKYQGEGGEETLEMLLNLYSAVEKGEGVIGARKARRAGGEARFKGYGEGPDEDDAPEDWDEDGLDGMNGNQKSSAWWPDYISGCPSSLAETIMELLDSGFTPGNCPILREKLRSMLKKKIENKTEQIRFDVPQSLAALVIPDDSGKLGKREIFIRASRNLFKTVDGVDTDILVGDVVITRNPCKVATDAQKVKAVDCPELLHYVDIIVCNVADHRRLLDFLSGGDYDGDRCSVFWEPEIVQPFVNAPIEYSKPDPRVEASFHRDSYKVSEFLRDSQKLAIEEKRYRMQKYLFSALRNTATLGTYSVFHDNAIHKFGYSHPISRQLAAKFNTAMDSAKSGHKIKGDCYNMDHISHGHTRGPWWKEKLRKSVSPSEKINLPFLERKPKGDDTEFHKGRDEIMSVLHHHAGKTREAFLAKLDERFKAPSIKGTPQPDPDLDAPWKHHNQLASVRAGNGDPSLERDLEKIKAHVGSTWKFHEIHMKKGFTSMHIVSRQDILRDCSRRFMDIPPVESMECLTSKTIITQLCASYAYCYHREETKWRNDARFPFNVAFTELCKLKSSASGPMKPTLMAFYERSKLIS